MKEDLVGPRAGSRLAPGAFGSVRERSPSLHSSRLRYRDPALPAAARSSGLIGWTGAPTGAPRRFAGLFPLREGGGARGNGSLELHNRKRPAGGGGALLGLLQGGENWERGEGKPDLACRCGGGSGCRRLFPVAQVADWRTTGAPREGSLGYPNHLAGHCSDQSEN